MKPTSALATFENMILTVWTVWAAQCERQFKNKIDFDIFHLVSVPNFRIEHGPPMHTLKFSFTFWIFEIYTIICSNSYYTQGLGDFSDFCGVSVIDQKSKTISVKLLDQWAAAKLPQIVLLEQLVSSRQIYLPPGGY